MESLLEAFLVIVVFPLVAAIIARGGVLVKIGFAIGAGIAAMIGATMSVFLANPVAGLLGIVLFGGSVCIIAFSATGQTCRECRRRIHSQASICPYCHTKMTANAS